MIYYHMLRFCQNTRPRFLARNTPTPLISDSLGSMRGEGKGKGNQLGHGSGG